MPGPTARVLTLLELLQSGGLRTVAELAGRLDVDERTVRRYVDHLLDLDVPVESVRGRHGGYRLAAGYRMPPLMLRDDEALAVLLGLLAGQRAGLLEPAGTASETAAAKIRRVLPERLTRRLDALLDSVAFTAPPGRSAPPRTEVLLAIADAVHHHRPVSINYTAADGRRSDRTLHPYGLVAHSGRWYVTGEDPAVGENRTFRLDRIAVARTLPGSFDAPAGFDPAEHVLSGLATAPYRHEVLFRVEATAQYVRGVLPVGVAIVEQLPPRAEDVSDTETGSGSGSGFGSGSGSGSGSAPCPGSRAYAPVWSRVEMRVDRLDWLPALLASLDRPFVIERPDELRDGVMEFAARLMDSARRGTPRGGCGS